MSTVQTRVLDLMVVWVYWGFRMYNVCRAWYKRNSDSVTICSNIDSDAPQ